MMANKILYICSECGHEFETIVLTPREVEEERRRNPRLRIVQPQCHNCGSVHVVQR